MNKTYSWPWGPFRAETLPFLKRCTCRGCLFSDHKSSPWLSKFPDIKKPCLLLRHRSTAKPRSQLEIILPPQGTSGNVWRHFWFSQRGQWVVVPLAPGGQSGMCYIAQDSPIPQDKNYPAQNANSTEIEKPTTEHLYFSHSVLHLYFSHSVLIMYTTLFLHLLSQQQ